MNTESESEPTRTPAETERIRADTIARVECRVLERKDEGGFSPEALCEMTYKPTGEHLRFIVRNIYDHGYFVNPDYEIAAGVRGGLSSFDHATKTYYWMDYRDGEWVRVRDLSEPELWCLRYLNEFPPVYEGLRM